MVNEKKDDGKQIEKPKERIVFGASGDIDGITVFTEITGKDEVVKESYYQPRSEKEKNQIIERNKTRRERERKEKQNQQKLESNIPNSSSSNLNNKESKKDNSKSESPKSPNGIGTKG